MGVFAKLSRILSREGVRGVINRVRHTPLRFFLRQAAPPCLAQGVQVVDHGHPALAAEMRALLTEYGVCLRDGDGTGQAITWHVGIPPAGQDGGVIVIPPDHGPERKIPWRRLRRAALVLDHDTRRLEALSRRRGRPHAMALPACLASKAALRGAIERVLIFAEARPATSHDFRPDLPPGRVPRLCLGLPEYPARQAFFRRDGLPGFHMIEGLRRQPGWIGAASSYRQIACALLGSGQDAAIICQDDAAPGPDFERRFVASAAYWQNSGADLFSGLITDVDDSFRITRVVRQDGMTFVHLNRTIGLVCNMFGPRALEWLAAWDEQGRITAKRTIDRHLGAARGLDVVTCLPFLVRHRDGLASSVWGFNNGRYNTLIDYSERRLTQMVAEFEKERSG